MQATRLQSIIGGVIAIAGVVLPRLGLDMSPGEINTIGDALVLIGVALGLSGEPIQRSKPKEGV